jgi:hypothetical protein
LAIGSGYIIKPKNAEGKGRQKKERVGGGGGAGAGRGTGATGGGGQPWPSMQPTGARRARGQKHEKTGGDRDVVSEVLCGFLYVFWYFWFVLG